MLSNNSPSISICSSSSCHHHSLLGEAIVKMGGDPIMGGSTCFWSGSNLKYTQNPICFLQNSINAEKLAVSNYRRAAACVKNASLSELLLRKPIDFTIYDSTIEQQGHTIYYGEVKTVENQINKFIVKAYNVLSYICNK